MPDYSNILRRNQPRGSGLMGLLAAFSKAKLNPDYDEAAANFSDPSKLGINRFVGSGPFGGMASRGANDDFRLAQLEQDARNKEFQNRLLFANEQGLLNAGKMLEQEHGINKKFSDIARNEALAEEGQAMGQVIGNLPSDVSKNIIPMEQAFRSPEEQARYLRAAFGPNKSVSALEFESEPGARAAKKFEGSTTKLGEGYYNPSTQQMFNPSRNVTEFEEVESQEVVDEPNPLDPTLSKKTIKNVKKLVPKQKFIPPYISAMQGGGSGATAQITPEFVDQYAAKNLGTSNVSNVPASLLSPPPTEFNRDKQIREALPFLQQFMQGGEQGSSQVGALPLNTKLQGMREVEPQFEGVLPSLGRGLMNEGLPALKSAFIDPLQNLGNVLSSGAQSIAGPTIKETAKGIGETAGQARQALIRGKNEQPIKSTAQSPLAIYLELIRRGIEIPFDELRQILEGATSYLGDRYNEGAKRTEPLPMKKKQMPKRNFSVND